MSEQSDAWKRDDRVWTWRYDDAPAELRALFSTGGDMISVLPPGNERRVSNLVEEHTLPCGRRVVCKRRPQ